MLFLSLPANLRSWTAVICLLFLVPEPAAVKHGADGAADNCLQKGVC